MKIYTVQNYYYMHQYYTIISSHLLKSIKRNETNFKNR